MSVPCEVAVKCVLPVVRAMMARELTTRHQLKQVDAAKLLGVSQPAISLYYRSRRGKAIDLENDHSVKALVAQTADSLVENRLSCTDLILMYCEICRKIRSKGLLCKLHKAFDPAMNIEKCGLCTVSRPVTCE
jgi:predicted transcriptional regulator